MGAPAEAVKFVPVPDGTKEFTPGPEGLPIPLEAGSTVTGVVDVGGSARSGVFVGCVSGAVGCATARFVPLVIVKSSSGASYEAMKYAGTRPLVCKLAPYFRASFWLGNFPTRTRKNVPLPLTSLLMM